MPAAIAWLKLEALGAGVKLARERVANANAVCRSPLKLAAVACHSATALLCLGAWARSVPSNDYFGRLVRGKAEGE